MPKISTDALRGAIKELNSLENEILNSDEFWKLQKESEALSGEIEKISVKLSEMKEPIRKKQQEVYAFEQELIVEAVARGETSTEEYVVKFSEKKAVNKEKLFKIIDDIDTYVLLSSVTQKDLTAYAKDHKDIKKPLEGCVEVISKAPTSVTIL